MNASELLRPAPVATPAAPPASALRSTQRRSLLEAGAEVRDCHCVLAKTGLNIVGEVLKGQGDFVESDHYPRDDVFDDETASHYCHHARRAAERGHFRTIELLPGSAADVTAGCSTQVRTAARRAAGRWSGAL